MSGFVQSKFAASDAVGTVDVAGAVVAAGVKRSVSESKSMSDILKLQVKFFTPLKIRTRIFLTTFDKDLRMRSCF